MYEHKREAGMWVELSQRLRQHIDLMVERNSIPKSTAIADAIGMSHSEFYNKVAFNPRTPLTDGERVAIEKQIAQLDNHMYNKYLRTFHCCEEIHVKDRHESR